MKPPFHKRLSFALLLPLVIFIPFTAYLWHRPNTPLYAVIAMPMITYIVQAAFIYSLRNKGG